MSQRKEAAIVNVKHKFHLERRQRYFRVHLI